MFVCVRLSAFCVCVFERDGERERERDDDEGIERSLFKCFGLSMVKSFFIRLKNTPGCENI